MKLILKKLIGIQAELKAPKNQNNSFGKYKYRSCEDILEAVKPLLVKREAVLTISDTVVCIDGRFYVESTATLMDVETGETMSTKSFAREEETKKGMDGAQITGAASSYARKYALNGLFAIDDTKDADVINQHGKNDRIDRAGIFAKVKELVGNGGILQEEVVNEVKACGKDKMLDLDDESFMKVARTLGVA
jgi:hypothetical protein